jgi:hypothetical protein
MAKKLHNRWLDFVRRVEMAWTLVSEKGAQRRLVHNIIASYPSRELRDGG